MLAPLGRRNEQRPLLAGCLRALKLPALPEQQRQCVGERPFLVQLDITHVPVHGYVGRKQV
jgi:hypothetical protein